MLVEQESERWNEKTTVKPTDRSATKKKKAFSVTFSQIPVQLQKIWENDRMPICWCKDWWTVTKKMTIPEKSCKKLSRQKQQVFHFHLDIFCSSVGGCISKEREKKHTNFEYTARCSTRQSINTHRSKHGCIKQIGRAEFNPPCYEEQTDTHKYSITQHSSTVQCDVRRARKRTGSERGYS